MLKKSILAVLIFGVFCAGVMTGHLFELPGRAEANMSSISCVPECERIEDMVVYTKDSVHSKNTRIVIYISNPIFKNRFLKAFQYDDRIEVTE